jgi:hypothetical protein
MKNILKEVDKILKELRQKEVIKVDTKVDLLTELIRRTQARKIFLTAKSSQGKKETLMVSENGVFFLEDKGRHMYNRTIDFSKKNIEEWVNNPEYVGGFLQKALEKGEEIQIEIK